ncbi:myoneurin [Drosophila grimshawi]|uniref:GH23864 n=1 Tax=Drosophila grimshawi TaxID=7222 RepID=B4JTF7_DROGR|nr:myoneurin [Drosophila grimshawi]EDV95047.1 GH23864 [Drosophila grimshawi]
MSNADEFYPDIEAWCRLCLNEHKDAYTIFADDDAQLSIPMRLMACLSLEAKSTDGLPKRICGDCRYQLEKSFVFRQRSQAADKKLRKHIRLVSMGKKSRVFAKQLDDSDEDELEFEESTAFIEQMEDEHDKRSQKWRKKYKQDIEKEFASRLEASREQLTGDLRKQLMEEVRSDVRLQLRDEVQEESRKEQLAKLLGELEVFLVEKKSGLWQPLGELPPEPKANSQSLPVSPPTEAPTLTSAPTPAIKPSPTIEPRQLRKRERNSSPTVQLKRCQKLSESQDTEFVLETDSKVDQISVGDTSEGFPDIKMVGAGDIVTSKNGEIYIINAGSTAPTSTSSIEFRQDKSITSYNIKDNGDIQFTDAKSEDLGDVVVFDLHADVGDEQQLYEFNDNVIILSNEKTTNDIPTPVKRSKNDFVLKRAPRSTKPSIGRVSDTLKTFQCQLCPIAFATEKLLSRHLSTHIKALKNGNGGALRCPVCDLQLSCASSLKRHMIIHTGLKPYKCDECDLSFSQREVLKRHMDRHTGTKRHQCPQCETCFAQKTNLQQHVNRMHSKDGERQHKCHLCKSSFNHVSGLSRHLVTHAGVTFACKECGRQFNDRSAVQRHLQNVHKIKDECAELAIVGNASEAEFE